MPVLRPWPDPGSLLARAGSHATVVEVPDRAYLRVDAEGRWAALALGRTVRRRALDGRVLEPTPRGFRPLDGPAARRAHGVAARLAARLLGRLDAGGALVAEGDAAVLRARLARAAATRPEDLVAEAARFAEVWPEPVPILPPHRYRDLVLLPAVGCPRGTCAFCAFYRDRPFRVLEARDFATHLEAVVAFFGAALAERDGVFLGSASALSLPDPVLRDRLAAVAAVLGRPRRGVAAFHDPDRSPPRDAAAWRALAAAGLREATLGLETADAALRAEAGKPGDLERFAATVAAQKAAGLRLALTVLVGLGGAGAAARHRQATVAWIARQPLDAGDLVYLSPLEGALDPTALRTETRRFREALAGATAARPADYRIDRFAWLA